MRLPVLTAADGAAWESGVVRAFEHAEHGLAIARRCVDLVDLLSLATAGHGCVALVAARLRGLDADAVDRLMAAGVIPVCVVASGDPDLEDSLRSMGVAHIVRDDADVGVIASVLVAAAESRRGGSHRSFADPVASTVVTGPVEPEAPESPIRRGSVVAVWGPTGAPGRTTVAANLADEVGRLGASALLIDADVYGGPPLHCSACWTSRQDSPPRVV